MEMQLVGILKHDNVDKGENLIQTAKRETYEETSLKISKLKP